MSTPPGAAPVSLRVPFDAALEEEIGRLDLAIARVWRLLAIVGVLGGLVIAAVVAPALGAWGMAVSGAYLVWFTIEVRLRERGATPRLRAASAVIESTIPWVFMLVLMATRGAEYALGSWVPPLLFAALIVTSTSRLRPLAPLLLGSSAAIVFALLYLLLLRDRLSEAALAQPLYGAPMQLARALSLLLGGTLGMLVARGLRATIAKADQSTRAEELFGKYRLLDRIASGGMGVVHHALYCPEGGFERPVAVKRIHPHLARETTLVAAFRAEAELCSRLVHPNIVQVLDFGREQDTYFLAMEYVHGLTLASFMRRARRARIKLPPPLVAYIGREILLGLHHAHAVARASDGALLRVVHRDLSPSNILLSTNGEVKITDFGVAKVLFEAAAAHTRTVAGHTAYMAPEQARALPIDPRCDLFAAAIVMWELLTGGPLFGRAGEGPTLLALMACEVEPPSALRPELSDDWDRFLAGALQPEPEDRYPSASAMLSALELLEDARDASLGSGSLRSGPAEQLAALVAELLDMEAGSAPPQRAADDEAPTRVIAPAAADSRL